VSIKFRTRQSLKVRGVEGMTPEQIEFELQRGGKFVLFQYCISALVVSFRRSSNIFFMRAGKSRFFKGLPYTLLTLLAGWWAIPRGPIWTIKAIVTNLRGGKDMTKEVMTSRRPSKPIPTSTTPYQVAPRMASTTPTPPSTSPTRGIIGDSKYCPNCGTQMPKAAAYCPNCGSAQK
jgi:zinc ribbon protein